MAARGIVPRRFRSRRARRQSCGHEQVTCKNSFGCAWALGVWAGTVATAENEEMVGPSLFHLGCHSVTQQVVQPVQAPWKVLSRSIDWTGMYSNRRGRAYDSEVSPLLLMKGPTMQVAGGVGMSRDAGARRPHQGWD